MRLNRDPSTLYVGQKVVTDWCRDEADVVRTLTKLYEYPDTSSGYRAAADGGEACRCCARTFANPVPPVDAAWFRPAEGEEPEKGAEQ